MSPEEKQDRQERSIKLCQMIYDRQTDNVIGYEIRKMLEGGVLIDFQDQNRNKKTALHLAIVKCDVICVKFLIQFRPSLEVKDGDGKTPLELARTKGFQAILEVLLNSSFDVVNESYIEVIDYESITRKKIEAIKLRPTFKVVKLTNCPSVDEALRKLTQRAYTTTFNESSHLFFFAIETKETNIENDDKLMKKVLNLRRPIIVQLSSSSSQNSKIYFKDEKDFVEITDTPQITQEEFNQAFVSEKECNMKLLVAALRSNLFGHLTGDLLDAKLNTNEGRNEAVNQFARSNALCHRFFKLFDESQPQVDTVVAALSFKGDQSLLALLDLPFELNDEKLKLTEYQQDILKLIDCIGYNLLMMAVELFNLAAVKLLLRGGCDFNHSDCGDNHASDICWDLKAFDCLAELIEAGSPYPNNFSTDKLNKSSEAYKRINKVTELINSFHANIEDGNIEEVKKFITSHPHIKHAFDTRNKSALTVALLSNQVDIYSLLMSKGFEPGVDDEYRTACHKSKFKNEIRNSHRKYFKEALDEPYLKRLLNKFRLSFGSNDRANCLKIIRRMFDELNEIGEIIPILQICSTSDKLKIVFDFKCDSVADMDVTKDSNSLGVTYPNDGFVYICANNHKTEFYEVIGTLIHELTHYAMKLTYNNSCKPYDEDDNEKSKLFGNVSNETKKICNENPSTDSIITSVFSYYSAQVWHQELIVRVPELLAHHKKNPTALQTAERNTPELFHFYREKTLKDVVTQSKVLKTNYELRKLNVEKLRVVCKLERVELSLSTSSLQSHGFSSFASKTEDGCLHVTSNCAKLALNSIYKEQEKTAIFSEFDHFTNEKLFDLICKTYDLHPSLMIIVDCEGSNSNTIGEIVQKLASRKIRRRVIFVTNDWVSIANTTKWDIIFQWRDLDEETQQRLMTKHIFMQGQKIQLGDIFPTDSDALDMLPIQDLIDEKVFVGDKIEFVGLEEVFVSSGFKNVDSNAIVSSNVVLDFTEKRAAIISATPGMGKTINLKMLSAELQSRNSGSFVVFWELSKFLKSYQNDANMTLDFTNSNAIFEFLRQKILKFNSDDFCARVFRVKYDEGSVTFFIDGFDEISSSFKMFITNLLKALHNLQKYNILISTRPQLRRQLGEDLDATVYELQPFSLEQQHQFYEKFLRTKGLENEMPVGIVDSIIKNVEAIELQWGTSTSSPLLMQMVADICCKDPAVPVSERNLEAVYNKFCADRARKVY